MSTEPPLISPDDRAGPDSVEMPKPTVAPMVLSLGLMLLATGVVWGSAFLVIGARGPRVRAVPLDCELVAGPGTYPRAPRRTFRSRQAGDRQGGTRHTVAARRSRIPHATATASPPHLCGRAGRDPGRLGDPVARLDLRRSERPRHLVPREFAGRHGRAGNRQTDSDTA